MHRNRIARVLSARVPSAQMFSARMFSAVVLAGALAMTGCASAATKTTNAAAPGGTSAAMTTRAAANAGGPVHIVGYSINSDGPGFRVILTGAVGDYGPALTIYPDGKVDPEHTGEMQLDLSHGSFRINIAGFHEKIISAYSHWPANASTCSGSIMFPANAPIVTGSGTGLYQGISGSFKVTVMIDEVDLKPVCDGTSKFLSQVILLTGSGTVSF